MAAIAFRRKFCSLMFRRVTDMEFEALKLNEIHSMVPTAILLKEIEDSDSHLQKLRYVDEDDPVTRSPTYKVMYFGYEAEDQQSKLRPSDRPKCLYFELNLHNYKVGPRDTLLGVVSSAYAPT